MLLVVGPRTGASTARQQVLAASAGIPEEQVGMIFSAFDWKTLDSCGAESRSVCSDEGPDAMAGGETLRQVLQLLTTTELLEPEGGDSSEERKGRGFQQAVMARDSEHRGF